MFELIFGFYLFLFPLLLFSTRLFPVSYRQILIDCRTTIQCTLMLYSLFLVRQIIGLYQLTRLLKMNHAEKDYFGTSMFEMLLMIVLPFFLLVKKIREGFFMGILLWLLLLHAQMQKEFLFLGAGIFFVNAVLFYLCLLTAIYALIWLLNQPVNSSKD